MAAKPVGMINLATTAPSKTIEKLLNQRYLGRQATDDWVLDFPRTSLLRVL
jgi:hypothetical protein